MLCQIAREIKGGCYFSGLAQTFRSKMNFNIKKVQLWNDSLILLKTRDGLLETIQYPEKKMTFRKFLLGHYRAAICK